MAAMGAAMRFMLEGFGFWMIRAMELTTILNHCYPHRGFVYDHARFSPDKKSIEVTVRPRKGAQAVCSGCEKPVPDYDRLPERRFGFIPFWGPRLRRGGGGTSLGRPAETPPFDSSPHAVAGPMGAQAFLEGNRRGVSHLLGPGLRRGRVCRSLWPGASHAGVDLRHQRG